jgi:8-oxo-dGTP pyrophosphatase MutT (NUDIX family)
MVREKYSRATGVIVRDGKVLLVRERRGRDFGLPGGRIHAGETSAAAVTREIYEEVGLSVSRLVFAGSHEGRFVTHRV